MTANPHGVPATPVYTITLTADGALIDGEPLPVRGGEDVRTAALADIRVRAALHGRPVRVTAKEPDAPVIWLVVDVDGTVTTLHQPHPAPPQPAAANPSAPAAPAAPQPQAPAAASPRVRLPDAYRPLWEQIKTHERAGALVEAIITADQLETALARDYGPHHPLTAEVLSTRAWLTLRRQAAPAELVPLLIETVRRRRTAQLPDEVTRRYVRNAHTVWRTLAGQDAATAREVARDLLDVLGDDPRAGDVVRWIDRHPSPRSDGTARRRPGPARPP